MCQLCIELGLICIYHYTWSHLYLPLYLLTSSQRTDTGLLQINTAPDQCYVFVCSKPISVRIIWLVVDKWQTKGQANLSVMQ